jgi:hypothetical protein
VARGDATSRKAADFLGGPPRLFEAAGREQLIVLLEHGLSFDSTVLDIGCGVLRGGRWIIPLLDPEHYCGIEPWGELVERGLREFVDPRVVALKRPRFDHNDRFDFSVFGTRFTHFVARSIWTHTSKPQIETMLDGFLESGTDRAVMLASMIPASRLASLPSSVQRGLRKAAARTFRPDYRGDRWVGRSRESEADGMVGHSFGWVRRACAQRGLVVRLLRRPPLNGGGQIWAVVRRR